MSMGDLHHIPIKNIKHMTEHFDKLSTGKGGPCSIYFDRLSTSMARYSVSLGKIVYEPVKRKVLFHTKYNNYFKENLKVFSGEEFIAQLTQHIPPPRMRLIRYYLC